MTQQDRQIKKVKLYRTLKVVFYSLGFPLFAVAVFLGSIRFIGSDPFGGNTDIAGKLGFFWDINSTLTSKALYGFWIALAIWLFISIVHIILSKTVKNRRVRAMSVIALTLVVMMGTMLGIDASTRATLDKVSKEYPTVSVADYKNLLSYYRTISTNAHGRNYTEGLISRVRSAKETYHLEGMNGSDVSGVAGATTNKPATYFDIISDPVDGQVTIGVDISFKTNPDTGLSEIDCVYDGGKYTVKGDGFITKEVEGSHIVKLEPNDDNELIINGKTYSHYYCQTRWSASKQCVLYTWYMRDMKPASWTEEGGNKAVDGIYGEALYTNSGLVCDGWVFGLNNVLEILEDYYEAKDAIDNGDPKYYANAYASMYEEAWARRDDYYNGLIKGEDGEYVDPWITALYNQEVYMTERFSLTRGELDELLAKVGALLGDNKLFDYLFSGMEGMMEENELDNMLDGVSFLGGSLTNFFKKLNKGMALSEFGLDAGTMATVSQILQLLTGKTYDYVDDIFITLSYKAKDCYDVKHDNLYLGVVRGVGQWRFVENDEVVPVSKVKVSDGTDADGNEMFKWVWQYDDTTEFITTERDGKKYDKNDKEVKYVTVIGSDPTTDIMLDIDFNDEELAAPGNIFDKNNGTPTYAFDFDTLSAFLNKGLNNLLKNYNINLSEGTVGTIVNLVKTLGILKSIDVDGESYTGLIISGIEIPILNAKGEVALDINSIVTNLLQNWYFYNSTVIKPVWEFYADWENEDKTDPRYIAQQNYAKYERALYTGSAYGTMIGSNLIGDSLGGGAYPGALGLGSLDSVLQLKADLAYQPQTFPLLIVRDMIVLFSGVVLLFYFISFIAAQREEDYASGKMVARLRKRDKVVKKQKTHVLTEFDANDVRRAENGESAQEFDDASDVDELRMGQQPLAEDPAVPVDEKSDKEVL